VAVVLDKDAAEVVSQPAKSRSLRAGLALGMVVVVTLGFFVSRRRGVKNDHLPTDRIRSLAVLPLENVSGHKDEEYFADGMTDELITTLAKLPSLRIISRTSAMRYKGTNKPLAEIARELDVQAVVEGEVLHSGDRVRITAQLIEATTDRHLWAETYQRDVKDVLALQGEVARAIANEIRIKLTPQADIHLSTVHEMKPDAYEAHLKSRYFLHNQRGAEGVRKSIEYSQQAVQLDPNAALAYGGLAESYVHFGLFSIAPADEVFPKAMLAAKRALQLDPSLVAAHTSLGDIAASYTYNWALAERELTRAVQLGPNDPDAHEVYARYLLSMARLNEALLEMRRALALDPLSQLINRDMGRVLYYSRRYDEAIEQLKKAIDLNPMSTTIYGWLGWAYESKGMNDDAVRVFLKDFAVNGETPETIDGLRQAYARAGMTGYWRASLGVGELGRDPYHMGATLARLGDRDDAFRWLQKALDARSAFIKYIKVDPELDPLRADPRFRELVYRMGLPP
jgi:TolB-like protein/Tfp pilus assembly protein PilF